MKKAVFTVIMICFCLINSGTAYGESPTFSMQPMLPNSDQPQSGYYDLEVLPNEKKQLPIRLFNSSEEDIKVTIEANNATTNDNGITSYLKQEKNELDKSMKTPFSELATVKGGNLVTIPKKGSIDVYVDVQAPSESFEGEILGGIRATTKEDSATKNTAAVTSQIAYTVGVLLHQKGSEMEISPDMHLLGVKTEQRNARNYISANLQNAAPIMVKKLEVHAKVFKEDGKKILYEASSSSMRMAPNSNFNFGISLENQAFIAGKYKLILSGQADGHAFSFEEKFEITSKEATEWNKNAVYVDGVDSYKLVYMLISVVLVLCIVFIYWNKKIKKKGDV